MQPKKGLALPSLKRQYKHKDRLIATLAYQLVFSIRETCIHIENAIDKDPKYLQKKYPNSDSYPYSPTLPFSVIDFKFLPKFDRNRRS